MALTKLYFIQAGVIMLLVFWRSCGSIQLCVHLQITYFVIAVFSLDVLKVIENIILLFYSIIFIVPILKLHTKVKYFPSAFAKESLGNSFFDIIASVSCCCQLLFDFYKFKCHLNVIYRAKWECSFRKQLIMLTCIYFI